VKGAVGIREPHTIERPAGMGCIRYQFSFFRPLLGLGRLGPAESVRVYLVTPHDYPKFGEYTRCPAPPATAAAPSPPAVWAHSEAPPTDRSLVEIWRQRSRESYDVNNNPIFERTASKDVQPIALVPAFAPQTQRINGVVFQVATYDAFFAGSAYWATTDDLAQCAPARE